MSTRLKNLVNLNAKLDRVIEFRSYDANGNEIDDDGHPIRNTAALAGGAGLAGAGLYAAGATAGGTTMGNLANKARFDYGTGGLKGIGSTIGVGAKRAGSYAGALGQEAKNVGTAVFKNKDIGIGAGLKELFKRAKGVKFSSRHDRLVQLNAKIDSLIEFEKEPFGEYDWSGLAKYDPVTSEWYVREVWHGIRMPEAKYA